MSHPRAGLAPDAVPLERAPGPAMMPIVLTQPLGRVHALADWLRARGAQVHTWPMSCLHLRPDWDWAAWVQRLAHCDWAILPSPSAIEMVMRALHDRALPWPAPTGVALIGPGSQEALAPWRSLIPGLADAAQTAPMGPVYDAAALLAQMGASGVAGRRVAVVCRADAVAAWTQRFAASGVALECAPVYEASPLEPPETARADAARWAQHRAKVAFSLASGPVGARLASCLTGWGDASWWPQQPVLTQHPGIARALAGQGWAQVRHHAPGRQALWAAYVALAGAQEGG